ncbi:MAG: uroporphyrinogen decarboxylase family protein [Acidobacteriota bacterium]
MNGRERILAMLDGQSADRLPFMPITMMFAADHTGVKYLEYATDCHVQAEAQLRIAEDYDFDYVSVISDPGCEAADCGAQVKYFPDQPPALDEANALLADRHKLSSLKAPEPSSGRRMQNRLEAVALLKQRAGKDKLVEGWVEGPCAEAADLRGINNLMMDFYDDPEFIPELFEFVIHLELAFGKAQLAAGADLIGIGDAAASLVGPKFYNQFVWPYEKRLVEGLQAAGARTRLHICGNTRPILGAMGRLGSDMVDLDSLAPMVEGRREMGPERVLCGNIDPVRVLRGGTPDSVYEAVAECHREAGENFIVGAGCEVPRDTPPANVHAMGRYAREHTPAGGRTL